ncbi:MAG: hypothetical protein AAF298_29195, partial [Cyanobacteria bacterium P01_A01_bin.40]
MLTPDNLWRKSSFDDPQNVNRLIFALTAITTLTVLLGFEPLKAMEISPLKAKANKTNDYNFSARFKLTTESKYHTLDFNTKSGHFLQDTNLLAQAETPASEVESPQNLDNNSQGVPEQIVVTNFEIVGSSVFSTQELNQAVKSYRNRPLTLPELFQARSA